MISDNWQKLKSLLYPDFCILCQQTTFIHHKLCLACQQQLPYQGFSCPCCGLATAYRLNCCANCHHITPPYQQSYIPFSYQPPITQFIQRLKYQAQLFHAPLLAQLLLDYLFCQPLTLPEVIIPIPLHNNRLRQRGFNQALELARPIAKTLQIPIDNQSCTRIKNTISQTELTFKQRQTNISNAFRLNPTKSYQKIAIIDDVVTTGNTVREVAQLWQQAGVTHIQVWAIARANFNQNNKQKTKI